MTAAWRVSSFSQGTEGDALRVPIHKPLRFGREAAFNDVRLDHDSAAKMHFSLQVVNNGRGLALVSYFCIL